MIPFIVASGLLALGSIAGFIALMASKASTAAKVIGGILLALLAIAFIALTALFTVLEVNPPQLIWAENGGAGQRAYASTTEIPAARATSHDADGRLAFGTSRDANDANRANAADAGSEAPGRSAPAPSRGSITPFLASLDERYGPRADGDREDGGLAGALRFD